MQLSGRSAPCNGVKSSWIPSILFWSFCIIVQYYLLTTFHAVILDYRTENELASASRIASHPGLESPQTRAKTSQQQLEEKRSTRSLEDADGTFNGYPIYKLEKHPFHNNANHHNHKNMEKLYSQFQCVGETWHDVEEHKRSRTLHEQSWMFRSCRFQVFCYDTEIQEYVIYLDPERHQDSHADHHYHHTNDLDGKVHAEPHPSPQIRGILRSQNKQILQEVADKKRNTTTDFKHPTFIDDTATIYRNHTIVVNSNGEVKIGDTERGKQYGVSIGSINGKWGLVDIQLLKWFPEVRWGPIPGSNNTKSKHQVYMLPPSVTMVPFHSLAAKNPGHLVWDDFLPMYTLLEMFGFLDNKDVDLLPMRYILRKATDRGLWASCDWTDDHKKDCHKMLTKFGILMGTRKSFQKFHPDVPASSIMAENPNGIVTPRTASKQPKIPITTNRNVELKLGDDETSHDETPKLICAKNGLAGYGAISDHLPAMGHGWQKWDYWNSYNSGRGGQLWEFRNFMIHNLFSSLPRVKPEEPSAMRRRLDYNVDTIKKSDTKPSILLGKEQISTYPPSSVADTGPDEPLVVLYSGYSSQRRGGSMEMEAKLLEKVIEESGGAYLFLYGRQPTSEDIGSNVEIVVETHTFAKYTVEEQIQMASRAAAFLSFCGGGAITGSFLPKGGALHLYYYEDGGIEYNKHTGLPARLDWDFFNNCGYLHVKWLPYRASLKVLGKHPVAGEYENQALANIDILRADLRRIHSERVEHLKAQQLNSS